MRLAPPLLRRTLGIVLAASALAVAPADGQDVPAVYSGIERTEDGGYAISYGNRQFVAVEPGMYYTFSQMQGLPTGTDEGIDFYFGTGLNGTLYVGLIPYDDYRHPIPVYRLSLPIVQGQVSVDLGLFRGRYDMTGWEEAGRGTLGYRVMNDQGLLLYDGKVGFRGTGPFEIDVALREGPFVNVPTPNSVTISFETTLEVPAEVEVDGRVFSSPDPAHRHEIPITGLLPDSAYAYTVRYGDHAQTYSFTTPPEPGTRKPFTFSYSSDSRAATGGGERNLYGTNFYMVKRIMALTLYKRAAFAQFTGDLANGYLTGRHEMDLQYANWKRAVEPFGHYLPVIAAMGNHESVMTAFADTSALVRPTRRYPIEVDRFPFETESAEKVFADHFVNFTNGPESEDGAVYDPDPDRVDFPSYSENVFYYTWDNVAMVVLNSDYWYAPTRSAVRITGGNQHGYVMDRQMAWLDDTIQTLEADAAIDHVFVTIHTPFFPNGGHVQDDMWYDGQNDFRPYVAGRPVAKGIIERRDELLDLLVNRSSKVIALLTGDEHNYNRLEIAPEMERYPEAYFLPRVELTRTIHQINNGAAGAPYYAQEQVPWTPYVSGFTTQNAVVFFHIDGASVRMEVINPDTLEPVDELVLR